MKLKNANKKER